MAGNVQDIYETTIDLAKKAGKVRTDSSTYRIMITAYCRWHWRRSTGRRRLTRRSRRVIW